MVVKFRDKENNNIFLEQEYPDNLPILKMACDKETISIFLDPEGDG